jgi:hypothetical protein
MVQTISATVDFENDENNYPFHIAELEQLLLGANAENESSKSRDVYPIYVRNRLLNIVYTALANSSGSVNSNFAELIVNTAGFGWILTVCSPPKIHTGTTYLALKILTHLLEHPTLLEKFRDGTANGGWLNETDSVIRNRAAVLLGFSVAIGVGECKRITCVMKT